MIQVYLILVNFYFYLMCKKNILSSLYKQYGKIFIVTHIALSVNFYVLFYFMVKKGIDLNYYLKKIGINTDEKGYTESASQYLTAYAIYKVTMPIRLSISAMTVPLVVRLLKKLKR